MTPSKQDEDTIRELMVVADRLMRMSVSTPDGPPTEIDLEIFRVSAAFRKIAEGLTGAARDVIAERIRQKSVEGWTEEHDDEHDQEELADAAASYAMQPSGRGPGFDGFVPHCWPFDKLAFKRKSRRQDLVRSGALILAEIERLDRAEARKK